MLNTTNLIGLASADVGGPIYLPEDVYVGAFGGPSTVNVPLPSGTQSVIFTTGPADVKANVQVSSITLGGVAATELLRVNQYQEYKKITSIWAVNYSGSGPTTMSFTCGTSAVVMVFALKRRFVTIGVDDAASDITGICGAGPFQGYLDAYKDGLVVCSWRLYLHGASVTPPFTTFYQSGNLVSSIVSPAATEMNKLFTVYTKSDGGGCGDDGTSMGIVSFKADRFV